MPWLTVAHRGYVISCNPEGQWVWQTAVPRGDSFNRYFTRAERKAVDRMSTTPPDKQADIMRLAIDRLVDQNPAFTRNL